MIVQFPQPTLSTQLCNIPFLFSRETLPILGVQIWAEYSDKRLTSRSTSEQASWAPYVLHCSWLREVDAWQEKIVDSLHSHMWTLKEVIIMFTPLSFMDLPLGFDDPHPWPWFGARHLPVPWQNGHPLNQWWTLSWTQTPLLCSFFQGCDGSAPLSQDHKLC